MTVTPSSTSTASTGGPAAGPRIAPDDRTAPLAAHAFVEAFGTALALAARGAFGAAGQDALAELGAAREEPAARGRERRRSARRPDEPPRRHPEEAVAAAGVLAAALPALPKSAPGTPSAPAPRTREAAATPPSRTDRGTARTPEHGAADQTPVRPAAAGTTDVRPE
jgi:hypothetical protein